MENILKHQDSFSENVARIVDILEDKIAFYVVMEEVVGLDRWGDIIMEKEEVAVFRGGWQDRDGDEIVDDVLINAEAALSINFEGDPVPRTIYTRLQAGNRKALK